MQEVVFFPLLLGALSGGQALHLIHLPAMSKVAENSPPETSVHKFSVNLSASLSPVVPGFPLIINSSPLTRAFRVNWLSDTDFEVVTTGMEQLDFEAGPHIFDLQIYVKDDMAVTDLQVLTVQVTDVNEPPEFQGNLAKGLDLYIVEGTKPGFVYQMEAFDPEDTSQNLPLSAWKQPRAANQHRLNHYSPMTSTAAGEPARRWRILPGEPDISGNWASSVTSSFLLELVAQ